MQRALRQGDPQVALRVSQLLAACALVVVCVVLQPKHKQVELFQRSAAMQALKADDFRNRATLQALSAPGVVSDGWGDDDMDANSPPPEDIMAIQGAQASSIIGLDYMEATAGAAAATAAAAGPELIPLLALRQRYDMPARRKVGKQQLRTVDAPFRLSGYTVHPYDAAQPSADPWSGNPGLSSVPQSAKQTLGGGWKHDSSNNWPAPAMTEADYGAARAAAQAGENPLAAGEYRSARKPHAHKAFTQKTRIVQDARSRAADKIKAQRTRMKAKMMQKDEADEQQRMAFNKQRREQRRAQRADEIAAQMDKEPSAALNKLDAEAMTIMRASHHKK